MGLKAKASAWTLALVLAATPMALTAQPPQPDVPKDITDALASLHPQQGKIALTEAHASLDLGSAYDFYGPDDARKIITTIWRNPPDSAQGVLGLVMPAGKSPLSDAWGAVVTYDSSGYVTDTDAASANYDEILADLRKGEAESNEARKSAGYPELHLVGWAERPGYDQASHSVIWAQDLKSTGASVDSLNYDVRSLGRGGVLSLNLVSSMDQLPDIKLAAHEIAGHARFDTGARYADFDPNLDKKAGYGIGGLVAAGVGVAVAQKLGILAVAGKFLIGFIKPILIGLAAAFAAFKNKILGMFGRNRGPLEGDRD